jgi:hypothetical protein
MPDDTTRALTRLAALAVDRNGRRPLPPPAIYRSTVGAAFTAIEAATANLVTTTGMSPDDALLLILNQALARWTSGYYNWQQEADDGR